jgi:hypothetical protein
MLDKSIVYQFHNGCVNRDKRHQFKFRLAFYVFFNGQKIASFSAESITKKLTNHNEVKGQLSCNVYAIYSRDTSFSVALYTMFFVCRTDISCFSASRSNVKPFMSRSLRIARSRSILIHWSIK